METRLLDINDKNNFKKIRLELLKNEPKSFGSSFDEESRFEDIMWDNRLNKKHVFNVGTFSNNEIIGLAVFVMSPRKKMKHHATLNSMYIKKEYRNKGIAINMINFGIELLKKNNVEILDLSVSKGNDKAIKLYEKLGFIKYGDQPKVIKIDKEYINLLLYSREL